MLGLELLAEVAAKSKAIRLEVVEGPSSVLAQMLAQGKLDLAVLFDSATDGGVRMHAVVDEPLLLVGARGTLAGRSGSTVIESASLPLLLLSRPNGIREDMERLWAERAVKPQVVAEINAPGLLIEAVQAGLGFSVLPSCAMEDKLRKGDLDAIGLEGGALTRTVYLSTSRLFAMTRAAHIYMVIERLMRDAVQSGAWAGRWLGDAAEESEPQTG